jgi:predicted metal-dependent hydrolase
MRWKFVRRRKRRTSITKHYLAHKEEARALVLQRLSYWNEFYGFTYKRVAIRNTRRCWGSCTSLKNLNFSYKLLFLPPRLCDYIIVHELCHLKELNHKEQFWKLVAEQLPDYEKRIEDLKRFEKNSRIG